VSSLPKICPGTASEILQEFAHYPVVQHYSSADLEKFFEVRGAKVVGFAKSGLAQSIYAELRHHRLNKAAGPPAPPAKSPRIHAERARLRELSRIQLLVPSAEVSH
jgi:hypothetical protein